jgi:hypothetical protein
LRCYFNLKVNEILNKNQKCYYEKNKLFYIFKIIKSQK